MQCQRWLDRASVHPAPAPALGSTPRDQFHVAYGTSHWSATIDDAVTNSVSHMGHSVGQQPSAPPRTIPCRIWDIRLVIGHPGGHPSGPCQRRDQFHVAGGTWNWQRATPGRESTVSGGQLPVPWEPALDPPRCRWLRAGGSSRHSEILNLVTGSLLRPRLVTSAATPTVADVRRQGRLETVISLSLRLVTSAATSDWAS